MTTTTFIKVVKHIFIFECIYMDLSFPVISLIPVWIIFMIRCLRTCTQRNLVTQIPANTINTGILVSDYCISFAQVLVMFTVYNTNHANL